MADSTAVDVGLLALRLTMAFVLFAHATQKTLGWFSGGGLTASAASFERMGQRPGKVMATMAAACELATAILLATGLMVPLAAAIGLGTMLVAGTSLTRLSGTVWAARGGGEYPFILGGVIVAFAFVGPGRWSLDHALDFPWYESGTESLYFAVGALIVGVAAALPPLARSRVERIDSSRS